MAGCPEPIGNRGMCIQGKRWAMGVRGGVWVCGHRVWTRRRHREGSQGSVWGGVRGRAHTWVSERGGRGGEGAHVNMRLILAQEGDPSQSHPTLCFPAGPLCLIHEAPTSPEKGLHNAVTNDNRRCSGPSSHPLPVFEGLRGVDITRLLPRPPPHS